MDDVSSWPEVETASERPSACFFHDGSAAPRIRKILAVGLDDFDVGIGCKSRDDIPKLVSDVWKDSRKAQSGVKSTPQQAPDELGRRSSFR
jgi:hypothetical protein